MRGQASHSSVTGSVNKINYSYRTQRPVHRRASVFDLSNDSLKFFYLRIQVIFQKATCRRLLKFVKRGSPSLHSPYGDGGGLSTAGRSRRTQSEIGFASWLCAQMTRNTFMRVQHFRERSNDCAKLSAAKFSFGAKNPSKDGFWYTI